MAELTLAVIVPAAGLGRRFADADDAQRSKLDLDLAGKPVFLRALELFIGRPGVEQIILAVHPDRLDLMKLRVGDKLAFHNVELVAGGTVERWETVRNALTHVRDGITHIAVHDAVRPLTTDALIQRVLDAAGHYPAVIPAVNVSATLKLIDPQPRHPESTDADPLDALLGGGGPKVTVRKVVRTVDRTNLVEVQTPQVFERSLLQRAYAHLDTLSDRSAITDDASLIEAIGEAVHVVEGESTNLKITRPDDAKLAAALLRETESATAASLGKRRLFGDDDD